MQYPFNAKNHELAQHLPSASTAERHNQPSYSLELCNRGAGEETLEYKLLLIQEPYSSADLSVSQILISLGMHDYSFNYDYEWLHLKSLVRKGLPEPRYLTYSDVDAHVIDMRNWPRGIMTLDISHEHAQMIEPQWTIQELLCRFLHATRLGASSIDDLTLLQGTDIMAEPLSWLMCDREIIRHFLPWDPSGELLSTPIVDAEQCGYRLYINRFLGFFGYDTGSRLRLFVYDIDPDSRAQNGGTCVDRQES